jgi:hypothetical protein
MFIASASWLPRHLSEPKSAPELIQVFATRGPLTSIEHDASRII